jgi:DNA (cytosine-5)-methyltransferase 1
MKYLSVCSGIEAASVAWKNLGWEPTAFAEVEPFPSAVLAHHYPTVRNRGDMTKFTEWPDESIDLLVGGTPCQSFSVAGLRQGLKDPRGNLMLTYLAIADRYRPRWLVWENVPGVLSSNGGRDFGTFLGALVELGYGFAFRILDAQWFGVAQRRRRVFVIGCLGDATSAAKVLFERESVCRNPAPSREKGKEVAPTIRSGASNSGPGHGARSGDSKDELIVPVYTPPNVADCLRSGGAGGVPSSRGEHLVATRMVAFGEYTNDGTASTLKSRDYKDATDLVAMAFEPGIAGREGGESRFTHEVTGTLRKAMGDNQTAVAIAFHPTQDPISSTDISHALGGGSKSGNATAAVAFGTDCYNGAITGDVTATVTSSTGSSATHSGPTVMHSTAVRRLTPTECERLQGFPDGYTNIPWRKKTESPDGPRYKALGNSMAVPVMRWIGERIDKVNKEQS